MKKTLFIIFGVLFFISCEEEIKQVDDVEEVIELETEDVNLEEHLKFFNVSFDVPNLWTTDADTLSGMIQLVSPLGEEDAFREMINVVKGKTNGLMLNDFFDKNLATVQGMFDELIETESPTIVTINGREFKTVRYNYVYEGYPLTAKLYVTLTKDASYIINCSSLQNTYDNYHKDFETVVNSFVIED